MQPSEQSKLGVFRRRIVISYHPVAGTDRGEARVALEDDFHHFRVMLQHDARHVVAIDGMAIRHPYSLCPSAVQRLQELVGASLDGSAGSLNANTDASEQCTHLLDLAGLALAAAAQRRAWRQYDITIDDRIDDRTHARLEQDGIMRIDWAVEGGRIAGPDPFSGRSLREGMARWALTTLDSDAAEAAIVLRRCVLISLGRSKPLDLQIHAVPTGLCYAQQPVRAEQALRMIGSTWDFTARLDELCATDQTWLHCDSDH